MTNEYLFFSIAHSLFSSRSFPFASESLRKSWLVSKRREMFAHPTMHRKKEAVLFVFSKIISIA